MKAQVSQLLLSVLFYILSAILFVSCNVLSNESDNGLQPPHSNLQTHEKARVSYEAETVTVTRYDKNVPVYLKEQYTLQSIPVINRTRVQVSIDRSGQAHWVIENLEPNRKIPDGKHNIPSDPSPKVKKTVIYNNLAEFYDASGKLIRNSRIDMPDMTQINEFLKTSGGMQSTMDIDIQDRINRAKQQGSVIQELPNGNLVLRTKYRPSEEHFRSEFNSASSTSSGELEIMELVDVKRKVIAASALYDDTGAALEESYLKYMDDTNGGLVLKQIHSVSNGIDRNKISYKMITDTHFEHLKVIISNE